MSEETTSSESQDVNQAQEESQEAKPTETELQTQEHETRAQERIRELVSEKKTLARLVETLSTRPQQTQPTNIPKLEDPNAQAALEAQIAEGQRQVGQVLGGVADKVDELESKDIPGFKDPKSGVKDAIEELRQEYVSRKIYLTRLDAYGILIGRGVLKPPIASSKEEPVVERKPTKVVTETKSAKQRLPASSTKTLKEMTPKEQDEYMADKVF